jgi:hypothetical protein
MPIPIGTNLSGESAIGLVGGATTQRIVDPLDATKRTTLVAEAQRHRA